MNDETQPIDRLIQQNRIRGQSRIITHDAAEKVTVEEAQQVIDQVKQFAERAGRKQRQIARAIGCAQPTLWQVMRLAYKGDWQSIILDLDRWLEDELKREASPSPTDFVFTRVAEEMITVAEATIAMNSIGLVYDRHGSGIGKTLALKAIAADKPGAIYISVETANASPGGIMRSIAMELHISGSERSGSGALFTRVKKALIGTNRLLLVDEIHKLCDGRDDRAFHVLRDLHDATGIPMLWCGTTNLLEYFDRKTAGGREPLAQIRRRIGIARDLRERTGDGTNPGEPLFTVEEIRKVFGRSKMRLAPDATRYLMLLANLPDSGGLGACRNLVVMATKVNEAAAELLTADMLRAVHRLLVNHSAFEQIDRRMEEQQRPMSRVG